MDDSGGIVALAASAGIMAGALAQGVLWLWDKTDHRFRTVMVHLLLVFGIVLTVEKMVMTPLGSLRLVTTPSLTEAVGTYGQGLRMGAALLFVVPLVKWIHEQLAQYAEGLRKRSQAGVSLSWLEKLSVGLEPSVLVVVLVLGGLIWYFTNR